MTAFSSERISPRRYPGAFLPVVLACGLLLLGPALAGAATLELAGPPGARLIINNQSMSYLPLYSPLQLAPGEYKIRVEMRGYSTYEKTITLVTDDWLRLHIRMNRLSRTTATLANFPVAGLGQFYMEQKTRGWVYLLTEAGGLFTALAGELQRSNYSEDYLLLKDKYDSAINTSDIAYFREQSELAYQNMQDAKDMRDTGLIVAGAAVVVSMLDALIFFPAAEAGPGPVPPVVGHHDTGFPREPDLTAVHVGVRLSF